MKNGLFKEMSLGKQNEPPSTTPKGDAAYLVELQENCVLQALSAKLDTKFKQVPFPFQPIKKAAIDEKYPKWAKIVVTYQNNAKLYISLKTWQKLIQLGWDV